MSALSTLPSTLPGAGGGVVLDAYGGAINQVKPGDTAFVHRDAVACAQYLITYPTTSPTPNATLAASAWLDDLQRLFAPVAQGSYQNYIDPTLDDWPHAYYGANLPRLRAVKQRYDPEEVFHFAQSIRPARVTSHDSLAGHSSAGVVDVAAVGRSCDLPGAVVEYR